MLHEDDVLPRGTESPFLSALHAKNDTTNLFGYKLGESTENNKRLLFFSGKETIQTFNGSIKAITLLFAKWLTCELQCLKILLNKDLFLNLRVIWSVNQIVLLNFLMVSFLILLSSLRVYVLKQLFFSMSLPLLRAWRPPRNFQTWIKFCYKSGIFLLKWTAVNGS